MFIEIHEISKEEKNLYSKSKFEGAIDPDRRIRVNPQDDFRKWVDEELDLAEKVFDPDKRIR